ncbi:MAG: hypothetical protein R3B48_09440 [Kofleriaceae bacterium]
MSPLRARGPGRLGTLALRARGSCRPGALGALALMTMSALARDARVAAAQPQPEAAQPVPRAAPATPPSAAPDDDAATRALLTRSDALAAELAKSRGLPLRRRIAKDAVDVAELQRRLAALLAEGEHATQLAREERLLKHWGLIPRELDYRAALMELLTRQVAGYYDPKRRRLTLATNATDVGDESWAEAVLVHELQHGLQDQAFALQKYGELVPGEDDAANAREAVTEGDATAVMIAWRMRGAVAWADPVTARAIAESFDEGSEDGLRATPLAVREHLVFPYRAGFAFAADRYRRGGWRALDAAFRRPPRSTEQILHPELYERDERPSVVPPLQRLAALPQAALLDETVWGELDVGIFLRSHGVAATEAALAAAGWNGDRVTVFALPGDRQLGIVRLACDTEADAHEALEALERALDAWILGAAVERARARSSWLDRRGALTVVERRGAAVLVLHDAPLRVARALAEELWAGWPRPAETP